MWLLYENMLLETVHKSRDYKLPIRLSGASERRASRGQQNDRLATGRGNLAVVDARDGENATHHTNHRLM